MRQSRSGYSQPWMLVITALVLLVAGCNGLVVLGAAPSIVSPTTTTSRPQAATQPTPRARLPAHKRPASNHHDGRPGTTHHVRATTRPRRARPTRKPAPRGLIATCPAVASSLRLLHRVGDRGIEGH
jgi:hypothetical protein